MDTKHQETVKREFAKQAQDFGRGGLTLARLTNRVINGLPRNGSVSDDEGAALWEAAAALEAGLPEDVLEMTHGLVDHCRETGSFTGRFSMRYCLGVIHDQYMRRLNFRYWDALEPQS